MRRWDAILIGTGISCLTAAAILARKGLAVCLIERHVKPGGYLHCFNRFGARFDTGAHYVGALGKGEPFRTLLEYVGVYDDSLFVPLDPEGFDELRFPSFSVCFAKGYDRTGALLAEQFPAEQNAIRAYLARVKATAALFPTYEFSDEPDGPALLRELETSLQSVVEGLTRDPRLQCVLYAYCALHGVQPADVPFGLHAVVTDSLLRGAYGFRAGGDALANRFVEAIERSGGRVLTRCEAVRFRVEGDRIAAVVTADGEELAAETIISGIHPKATFRLFGEGDRLFSPAFRHRLGSLAESPGAFGVYAACNPAVPVRRDRNLYCFASESPAAMLSGEPPSLAFAARPDRDGETGDRVPLILHGPCPFDQFAPWKETRYGRRATEYQDHKEKFARELIRLVDGFVPGIKDSIQRYVASTPVTNMHFNGAEEGSPYGIYHSIANSGVRALGPRTHVGNLLLTGQSCLFPGLIGAAVSGLRSAGHVVGIKPLLRELVEGRA